MTEANKADDGSFRLPQEVVSKVLIMAAEDGLKAPKYLGVSKSVNPPSVPADLKS